MSTPTLNPAALAGYARVVDSLEHQVTDTPRHPGPPELHEILQLAETMRIRAGDVLTPVLDRLWAAATAIDEAEAQIHMGAIEADDLLDVDPDTIKARVLDGCRNRAALDTLAFQTAHRFRDGLARSCAAALKDSADAVVKSMSAEFNKHIKVITTAADLGITEHTENADLLATGTPEQITAWRALPDAAAALEQIAALRIQLTRILRYGPPIHPVHLFVTGVSNVLDAEGLAHRYDGETETVQYNTEYNASTLVRVRTQRLGGRWLALANTPTKNVRLHLNSAAEVEKQYAGLSA